ncbi:sigma-70 family RNA polymerase sigma factor [Streptomyces sp. G-G2]|uniref:sigma-70 family RNA polymerase sigma factor n=1 Tax=Streptomyces sp. G-G2 TaxID=3046201 RepID=UPI0024B8DF6B|nr:sigma-70 family RNA polymerase sigma factor [Streptomyces sp. G-G2]MDJ0380029.1 sigma-70 family RNA polymerase sigma factor [Streptomyces sp. G-G2]
MAGPLWPRGRRGSTDEALIRSVYEEHGHALLAYATRLTGDRATAEDVVQETFIRAWRHADVLVNGKGSVRGWLLTVARNIITDRFRARAARPKEVSGSAAMPPVELDHADSVVDSMTVLGALDQLSPEHRDVITELYYRQLSVAEAADTLGIPAGTVKSRSHYALKALREAFREAAGADHGRAGKDNRGSRGNRPGRPPQQPGLREVVA